MLFFISLKQTQKSPFLIPHDSLEMDFFIFRLNNIRGRTLKLE